MIKFEETKRQDIGISAGKKPQLINVSNIKWQEIVVENSKIAEISVENYAGNQQIDIRNFYGISVNAEEYEGSYTVTPKISEQKLPTKNKFLIDDVIVEKIPITTVSNTSGGTTVIIGGY